MIWYRHWLEMRGSVAAAVGTAVIGSLFYTRDMIVGSTDGSLTTRVDRGLFAPLLSMSESLNASQINLIAFHEEFSWIAILLLSFMLAGDGLRVFDRWTGARLTSAALFTLSLPVSRRRLVITRIVSTYVIATVSLFLIAGTNATVFATTAHPVPLEQLLLASAFASLLVLFWSSVFVLVTVIIGAGWGMAVSMIAMLLSTPAGMYGMSVSAAWRLEIGLVVLLAVVLGFVLLGTVAAAASEEV